MSVTLRQYYAAKAMYSFLTDVAFEDVLLDETAKNSFAIADAMIKFEQNDIKTGLEGTVLGTPIATTSLSVYILNRLKEIPVNNLNDLVTLRETDLMEYPGIGRKAINDIKAMLDQYGLKLADKWSTTPT